VTAAVVFGMVLAHFVGDYITQSDWMALEKTSKWWPAWAHALTYGAPFLLVTHSPLALAVIVGTHAVIDHYRLARYVVWAKNQLAPAGFRSAWADCMATGYPSARPMWMTVWLMIVADNVLHIAINAGAVEWL